MLQRKAERKKSYLWYPCKQREVSRSEYNQEVISSGYAVHIGVDVLSQLERDLCTVDYSRKFILVDENTIQHCLPVLMSSVPSLRQAEVVEIESGESNKTIEICIRVWEVLTELNADRHCLLINLGGGVIGDLGGFVASTYKRGIHFVNVPTSLLAQVDASVGGKVGVNLEDFKNQVGVFNNPQAVYINPQFLNTLPRNHVMSGFAEMIKHGLISDTEHFHTLVQFDLSRLDLLEPLIEKSVRIKNKFVLEDPTENNVRKCLNFGHTTGHALETFSHENQSNGLLHGTAVAIGMICEAWISVQLTGLTPEEFDEISDFVLNNYPPFHFDAVSHHRIIEIMQNDKKNFGDRINFTLLSTIGSAVYDQEVSADKIIDALNQYQKRVKAIGHEA